MRLLLSRSERVGSRLRRSGDIFVAQQKRETLDRILDRTVPTNAGILRQIQEDAVTADTAVSELLRRCQVFAARTGLSELGEWVKHELNGYPEDAELPEYRIMNGTARGHFSGAFGSGLKNAVLPAGNLPEEYRDWARTAYVRQAIASLEEVANDPERDNLVVMWPGDLVAHVQNNFIEHMVLMQAWLSLGRSQFVNAVESVRNRILSFALEAEQYVEAHAEEPKAQVAGGLANVFHNHIYGPVGNIAQGSSNVTQVANVPAGDMEALKAQLSALGVDEELLGELEAAINEDDATADGKLGERVSDWIGKAVSGAVSGAKSIAVETATTAIPQLIQKYYGLE